MTLKLEGKKAIVTEVAKVATEASSALAAEYRGLTVAQMTELRAKAREKGVTLRVVRNTLARRALQDTEFACLTEILTGPLFLAFAKDDPGAVARLIRDFAKDHEALQVKALAIGGKLLGADKLGTVADLPTKDQAIAMLLGLIVTPIRNFVCTLAEPYSKMVRTFGAISEAKQA